MRELLNAGWWAVRAELRVKRISVLREWAASAIGCWASGRGAEDKGTSTPFIPLLFSSCHIDQQLRQSRLELTRTNHA